jgi:Flp pilus assembly protein TadG
MKKPAISRSHAALGNERGMTMVLVAAAMVAIVAMAALSIDVVTLYLDREEAQRSADAAALAAARVLSVSGITGDPSNSTGNWGQICGPGGMATQAAQAVVGQNTVASSVPGTINVSYSAGSGGAITSNADCQTLSSTAFGVNPLVTVKLTRSGLPTFFSRIWGNTANSVSATATAEAFNPSNSGNPTNQNSGSGGPLTPVQPMCVKPWVVPNQDPLNPVVSGGFCDPGTSKPCLPFVDLNDGHIINPGISLGGSGTNGVIGENFWLNADCRKNGGSCMFRQGGGQPQANFDNNNGNMVGPPTVANLLYVPGQVDGTPTAVPSCSGAEPFERAITGCDQPTNYRCGVPQANWVDLSINPNSPTSNGVQCLTNQGSSGNTNSPSGQDYLANTIFGQPSAYPFQILAGTSNPLISAGLTANTPITSSSSIVALPIYDNTQSINQSIPNNVTFVGFLQVFINAVDDKGNINVTVLNVAGCSNGGGTVGTPIPGTSPVPVRLITPP